MKEEEFNNIFENGLKELNMSLSKEQLGQFYKYMNILLEWNKVINLTTITKPEEIILKHFIDSLTILKHIEKKDKIIDVGTGAGFPGIPLKIYCPSLKVTLIDSLGKRLKFLENVIKELGLENISCEHARAEDAGKNKKFREKFDLVTARAVARLSVLSEYCLPLVKTGGMFIALKGSKYAEEILEGEQALKILGGKIISSEEVKLPGLDDGRAIIKVKKIKPTPAAYPRKAGTPDKQPLGSK